MYLWNHHRYHVYTRARMLWQGISIFGMYKSWISFYSVIRVPRNQFLGPVKSDPREYFEIAFFAYFQGAFIAPKHGFLKNLPFYAPLDLGSQGGDFWGEILILELPGRWFCIRVANFRYLGGDFSNNGQKIPGRSNF